MTHSIPLEEREFKRVEDLLGGRRAIRHKLETKQDAHRVILQGLPAGALFGLLATLVVLRESDSLEKAIGMSLRTFQRKKAKPANVLNQEQSEKTLKFAEILAKATEVFGTQKEAEEWLERPAMGLDNQRPIELLRTSPGAQLVEDFLTRVEYGVYT